MRTVTATLVVLAAAILLSAGNAASTPSSSEQHLVIRAPCSAYPDLCSDATPISKGDNVDQVLSKRAQWTGLTHTVVKRNDQDLEMNDFEKRRLDNEKVYYWISQVLSKRGQGPPIDRGTAKRNDEALEVSDFEKK